MPTTANDTRVTVNALQDKLYQAARREPKRRFHALYDKISRRDVLRAAWNEVRKNKGASGVDRRTIRDIERAGVEEILENLGVMLRNGIYCPHPVRRVRIPKAGGGTRPLGIPTVLDRVAQQATKLVLEAVFEADFLQVSYGFRRGIGTINAIEAVRQQIESGATWVLDADIAAFFDELPWDVLKKALRRRVSDRRIHQLIGQWLRGGVMDHGRLVKPTRGTIQGSPISPLLANVALHQLDQHWTENYRPLGALIRYADDLVVLARRERDAVEARYVISGILGNLGLRFSPTKTRIVPLEGGIAGFDFLGFHCRGRTTRGGTVRAVMWPNHKSMTRARERIYSLTAPAERPAPDPDEVKQNVEDYLRSWSAYYQHGNSLAQEKRLYKLARTRTARYAAKYREPEAQ